MRCSPSTTSLPSIGSTLRTSNPIESTFATVRHRTIRSKGCLSNKTALAMVFKLVEGAQKSWRRLDGHNQLPKIIQGVKFIDGLEIAAKLIRQPKSPPPDPSGHHQNLAIAGKEVKPYGDKVSGYLTYTKGGRMLWAHFGDNRPKPAMPFTDADRVKLFSTLSAGSGTYKVEGKTVTVTYDTSWHELWTGTTQKRTFEIVGNMLTVTSDPVKNANGVETRFVITLERVE